MGGFVNAITNPIEWLVTKLFTACFELLHALVTFLMENTEPQIFFAENEDGSKQNFFQAQYSLMLEISLYITVPLLLCAAINAMMKGGLRAVLNIFLVSLPISVLGGVAALAFAGLAQAINQDIVDFFDTSAQRNMEAYIDSIDGFAESAASLIGYLLFGGIFALMIMLAVLALFAELIAREITIYMALLFMPLAFSASVWPATRKWLYNMIELVLVMIFSKAIMVAVLSLGFSALLAGVGSGGGAGPSVGSQVAALALGGLLMFAASFALPVLVNFALSPNSSPPLNRGEVQRANPLNSTRQFQRGQIVQGARSFRRPRGGGGLSGSA